MDLEIIGARVHNLKNVSIKIPHGIICVITGVSGSGKTSLAFDTIYAEGQRRFIESMSSYARQFLGKLEKPDVDIINGLAPTISIQQKTISSNPRSTVGTVTEIYDYLKLLFARVGKTYSPISSREVKKHTTEDAYNYILTFKNSKKIALICKLQLNNTTAEVFFRDLKKNGFTRLIYDGQIIDIDDIQNIKNLHELFLVIDRFVTSDETEINRARIMDSIETCFSQGNGECGIIELSSKTISWFNNRFELDGIEFTEPNNHFFTFNNPFGACKICEGFGMVLGIDENLVFPEKNLSIYQGAIAPWKGETMSEYLNDLILNSSRFEFPIHRPIKDLSDKEYQLLWEGNQYFTGLNRFFKYLESKSYKIQYRVMLSRYRGKTTCTDCKGTRLRKDAGYVKLENKSIQDLVLMQIKDLIPFFQNLPIEKSKKNLTETILAEINSRLEFLNDVGLGYLTLNRTSNSLSGGEAQRIKLATSLGSSLKGSIYVLDEPSIGLHSKDNSRLISILKKLRNEGNTVIVVEHDEEIMRAADMIVDIGPEAGVNGGNIVFQGDIRELLESDTLTAKYLSGKRQLTISNRSSLTHHKLKISGAKQHNLKNLTIEIPLNQFVCISGISGSGKSTLVKSILYPAIKRELEESCEFSGKFESIEFDKNQIQCVELIDQNPIGRSSRSNPATYVKAFDEIRNIYADLPISKKRGYKAGYFSFNVIGGRCEMCQGEGHITVEMQFMADVQLKCKECNGKRYKDETLDVKFKGLSIYELLETTLEDCLKIFGEKPSKKELKIISKIQPFIDVGLGYLKLGQPSSTLSGGEAQRIKLASFLIEDFHKKRTLFIFDEPTTGLHFFDIEKLLISFQALIKKGHSLVVIEHNLDVLKNADYIIDMGPEGGSEGGYILFQGSPQELSRQKDNETGKFLKGKYV